MRTYISWIWLSQWLPELRNGPNTAWPPPTNLGPHHESQGRVLWWITWRADTWRIVFRWDYWIPGIIPTWLSFFLIIKNTVSRRSTNFEKKYHQPTRKTRRAWAKVAWLVVIVAIVAVSVMRVRPGHCLNSPLVGSASCNPHSRKRPSSPWTSRSWTLSGRRCKQSSPSVSHTAPCSPWIWGQLPVMWFIVIWVWTNAMPHLPA